MNGTKKFKQYHCFPKWNENIPISISEMIHARSVQINLEITSKLETFT